MKFQRYHKRQHHMVTAALVDESQHVIQCFETRLYQIPLDVISGICFPHFETDLPSEWAQHKRSRLILCMFGSDLGWALGVFTGVFHSFLGHYRQIQR